MGCDILRGPRTSRGPMCRLRTIMPILAFASLVEAGPAGADDPVQALEEDIARVAGAAVPAFAFIAGGSGVVVSDDGYVLTNNHVVPVRSEWLVRLAGGRVFRADVVGRDPVGDIALLKINTKGRDAADLPFVPLGDSDAVRVGDAVIAIGNPFMTGAMNLFLPTPTDYAPAVSFGIVSGLHRFRGGYSDAIQTNVAINPGSSGGPLLAMDGKLIGINGQIETRLPNKVNSGIGLAIPSKQILRFLEHLKAAEGGIVLHGEISGLDLSGENTNGRGARLKNVDAGSTAEKAGFRPGDLVVAIDAYPVWGPVRYLGVIGTYPKGQEVKVTVRRGEETHAVPVRLDAYIPKGPVFGMASVSPQLGVFMSPGENGLRVEQVFPGTPAEKAGLNRGDVITHIDGEAIRLPRQVLALLSKPRSGDEVKVRLKRGEKDLEITVKLPEREEP